MQELKIGEIELTSYLRPDSWFGAIVYFCLFVAAATLLSRVLRAAVHAAMTRRGHVDLTTINFLKQFGTALIWVLMLVFYAQLIPVLRSIGTALLAGASIASVVIGLAAQSTLGNLVAGVSITIYRPFQLGDTLQVATPTGTEIGRVEAISLGYTKLRTADGRLVVLPNSVAATQVCINLNSTFAPAPISVSIQVNREADLEAVRDVALKVATETVGEKAQKDCYLTKIEGANAVLELRAQASDPAERDHLRATLLSKLARRFAEVGLDVKGAADRPSFA